MTHATRQGQLHDPDIEAQHKYHFYQATNSNGPKRYLSNSNKSCFNLKWDSPANRNKLSDEAHKREQMFVGNPYVPDAGSFVPFAYYYPYAHPPPQSNQPKRISKWKPSQPIVDRTSKTTGLKQSEKSLNFLKDSSKLKVEHHYVDSPNEAQRIIDELRRKGFVDTGIEIPASYHD